MNTKIISISASYFLWLILSVMVLYYLDYMSSAQPPGLALSSDILQYHIQTTIISHSGILTCLLISIFSGFKRKVPPNSVASILLLSAFLLSLSMVIGSVWSSMTWGTYWLGSMVEWYTVYLCILEFQVFAVLLLSRSNVINISCLAVVALAIIVDMYIPEFSDTLHSTSSSFQY